MRRLILFLFTLLLLSWISLPAFSSTLYADVTNLIANPSIETLSGGQPTGWMPDSWGTGSTTLSVVGDAHSGSDALNINTTARTDGDAKWMPNPAAVTSGQTYTYSDYSKASAATQLIAVYTNASGTVSYYYLATVQPSTAWQANTVSLTVPANEVKLAVWHILQTAGSLTTDDFSLTSQAVVTPPPTGNNLIANPSMETANGSSPAGWQTDSWGANTSQFSYTINDAHTGAASTKLQMTSYTDGDAKWYFTPVTVQPNTSYTFSDYYKSTLPTSLVARFDNGSGAYTYAMIGTVIASNSWNQTTATFTTRSDTAKVTVLHLLAGVGILQTDDAALTLTSQNQPPDNLFPNPSLETVNPSNNKLPLSWQHSAWGANTPTFTYLANGHSGNHSIKTQITSYTSGSAYWYTAPQPLTGGQTYDFTDYYESNVMTGIDATLHMADGSDQDVYIGSAFESPASWTKFETQFTAPAGAQSITFYHDIAGVGYVTTDDFSLKPFNYQGFNRPIVSITDDDGYANFYTNGLPLLQKYGLSSTAYIISSYINAPTDYLSLAQLQGLSSAGVEIGSHSVDHSDLSTLTATQQDNELKNSQTTLHNVLGLSITDYAAPYGAYNQQIVTDAANYYQTYRGVEPGYNGRNNFDPMNLQVQNIIDTTTVADIQGWLAQAAATNTWLILVYHQINADPSAGEFNTYPNDFDAQLAAIKASGLPVETVSQAMAELTPQLTN
ncbi:MAG TPA: polysaccharide deacetylase family protein [Candidatus Saccharimonadales bacterium]|nr:polysaccharide deacetylase family protein [Candidatus Saccharimonadales bacterium]